MIYHKAKNIWVVANITEEYRVISHLENNLIETERRLFVTSFTKLLRQITENHIAPKSNKPYPFYSIERFMK